MPLIHWRPAAGRPQDRDYFGNLNETVTSYTGQELVLDLYKPSLQRLNTQKVLYAIGGTIEDMDILGDQVWKIGSNDYLEWQAKEIDIQTKVETPANFTAVNSLKFRVKYEDGTVYREYSTADASPKFVITDAVQGKFRFEPVATEFSEIGIYLIDVVAVDAAGNHMFPDDRNYRLRVIL